MTQAPEDDAPDLSELDIEEYAALLHQVEKIRQVATDQTGH